MGVGVIVVSGGPLSGGGWGSSGEGKTVNAVFKRRARAGGVGKDAVEKELMGELPGGRKGKTREAKRCGSVEKRRRWG